MVVVMVAPPAVVVGALEPRLPRVFVAGSARLEGLSGVEERPRLREKESESDPDPEKPLHARHSRAYTTDAQGLFRSSKEMW